MKTKSRLLRFILPVCLSLLFSAAYAGEADGASVAPTPIAMAEQQVSSIDPVRVELLSENEAIVPGSSFWVAVRLEMDKGWDTYWINPGDAGMPTEISWELPAGFEAGETLWPAPEKFANASLVGYGYTDSVLLLTEITAPAELEIGSETTLTANVSWLACNDSCVPGEATVALSLPIQQGPVSSNANVAAAFAKTRALLPHAESNVTVQSEGEDVVLTFDVPNDEIVEATFFPAIPALIDDAADQLFAKNGAGYTLKLKRAGGAKASPEALKGVLLLHEKSNGRQVIAVTGSVASGSHVTAASTSASAGLSFPLALGLAFLGGLILNVMPCVLPVIALKIFSFVKMAHEKRSVIFKHGGFFALGVLVSFWILSGALLILRAYGEGIGWGFQLQEPVFVVILALMIFLLGLSLFGVFEMGTSMISLGQKTEGAKRRSPLLGSFLSGVLATLVATPCTGPLLGPALGFAMTLTPVMALSIFTAMGIGMAFPYLLFSAFPRLVRFLPKPGGWMIVFKQLMGFLMMATVVWLVWVFAAQTSEMAILILLSAFVVLAIGGWIFGRYSAPHRKKITRLISTIMAVLIIGAGTSAAIFSAKAFKSSDTQMIAADSTWEAFSPERIAELRAEGTPVFVDFTAKWCLICQANKMTLHAADVEKLFTEAGVVKMIADWTKRDDTITNELQKLGRSGVPLYVLYPGDSVSQPKILPQTLTASVITDYINKIN